jgi:hypothetical protein
VTRLARVARSDLVRRDLRAAALPWITARVVVIGALGVSRFAGDQIAKRPLPVALHQGLFAWDAAYYRAIATHGYGSLPRAALRFFPLVPLLTRGLGEVFLGRYGVALIVIANVSALFFGALLHRLARRETGDAALATRAAWFAAVFPPFAALVLGYADATAMLLAVGVFLALRSRRFGWAAVLGVLAGACRPVGVLLIAPALVEAARGWSGASTRERVERAGAVAGPALGLIAFLAYSGVAFGNFFEPLTVQNRASLRGHVEFPVTSIVHGVRDLTNAGRFGPGAHVVWAVIFAALLVVTIRRLPAAYSAYAGVSLLLGLSAHNLDSFERYCASTLPFLLAAAIVTERPRWERVGVALTAAGLFAYATLSFFGTYVP